MSCSLDMKFGEKTKEIFNKYSGPKLKGGWPNDKQNNRYNLDII